MSTDVREILERIGQLREEQRTELRTELDRQEEQEWLALQNDARKVAKLRGIDDDAIIHAVESLRYGDAKESK